MQQEFREVPSDQKILVTEGLPTWEVLPLRPRNHTLTLPKPVPGLASGDNETIAVRSPQWALTDVVKGNSIAVKDYTDSTLTKIKLYGPACSDLQDGKKHTLTATFPCIVN